MAIANTTELTQFRGFIVERASAIAPGSLTEAQNCFVESDGTIRSRNGAYRINVAQLVDTTGGGGTNLHSHTLHGDTRYTAVSTAVKRGTESASPTILGGLNGNRLSFVRMTPSPASSTSFTYFANGQAACRIKDNGTTTQTWGIDGPVATAVMSTTFVVGSTSPATIAIDDFATANWNTTGINGTVVAATSTAAYSGTATQWTVPAGKVDQVRRTGLALNLSASSQDTAFIRVMLKVDNRQNLDHVEIAFNVAAATNFTDDYFYTRLSAIEASGLINEEIGFNTDNTWQEFKIRKSSFERVKPTGGSSRTWANVTGIQLTIGANSKGQVTVSADDARVEEDTHPEGTYDYKVTWWNDTLKIRSNERRLADIYSGLSTPTGFVGYTNPVTVKRQSVRFDRPAASTATTNIDAQVTHWEVWRRNQFIGVGDWQFVQRIAVGTTTQTDTTADIALGEALVSDQHIPPPAKFILGPFDNRMFAFGMSNVTTSSGEEESPWAVRYTPVSYPESWPFTNYFLAGSQHDRIMGGAIWAGRMYIFTQARVYQVVQGGSQSAYVALPTEAPIGTVSPYSISPSPYGIFYRALDGLYLFTGSTAEHVSRDLDPIFRSETVTIDGQTIYPINASTLANSESIVGAYANGRYALSYTDTNSARITLFYDVVLRTWTRASNSTSQSGWAVQRLSWEKSGLTAQTDNLEAGTSDGWLMLLDSSAGNPGLYVDGGSAAIPFAVQLKAFDVELKKPETEADIKEVILDLNTSNQNLTLQVSYDDGAYVSLGTVTANGRQRVILGTGTPAGVGVYAYKIAIRLSGNISTGPVYLFGVGVNYFQEPPRLTDWTTDYTTLQWPGPKVLQELVVEANTFSANVTITVEANGTNLAQTFTLNTTSRRVTVFSFNHPEPTGTTLRLKFDSAAGAQWKLYDWTITKIDRPLIVSRLATDRNDEGWPGEKLFKTISVEIDPLGAAVDVEYFVDDTSIGTQTISADTGQQIHSFSLANASNLERRGTTWYVTLASAATFQLFRAWSEVEKEPIPETFWVSPWTDDGYPAEKQVRQLLIDADTQNVAASATLYVDGTSVGPFSFTANGRRISIISLPTSPEGRLMRLQLSSSTQYRFYSVRYEHVKRPPGVTFFDTTPMRIFPIKKGWVRKAQIAIKNTAAVTGTLYVDGVSAHTFTVPVNTTDAITTVSFPIGLTGNILRLTLSSTASFQLFPSSYIEAHGLDKDRSFEPWRFAA